MSTYLELTNSAIIEAGVELDDLTSVDFASTTDPLQKRFKRWINQSLKEIEFERNELEYKNKQAQIVVYPRFLVIDGNRSVAPPANSIFEGDDTTSTFEVVSSTLLSGTWAGGDAEANLDFVDLSSAIAFNEFFDELSPTAANLNVFRAKWWGRYNLSDDVTDILEPNKSSFKIQDPSGLSTTSDNTGGTSNTSLQFVPWGLFNTSMETSGTYGRPTAITETPDGSYDFFPRPNGPYILTFEYQSTPQQLAEWDDTVTDMPALYQDAIVWRAVMYYADYDRKPDQFARAERRYEYYKNRTDANKMPVPSFGWNRYDSTWS